MSDINATCLPGILIVYPPYVGDEVNPTLTCGNRWAWYLSNFVSIVFMCCLLAFVECWSTRPLLWHEGVTIPFLNADTNQLYWLILVADLGRYNFLMKLDIGVRPLFVSSQGQKYQITSSCRSLLAIKFIKPTSMILVCTISVNILFCVCICHFSGKWNGPRHSEKH